MIKIFYKCDNFVKNDEPPGGTPFPDTLSVFPRGIFTKTTAQKDLKSPGANHCGANFSAISFIFPGRKITISTTAYGMSERRCVRP